MKITSTNNGAGWASKLFQVLQLLLVSNLLFPSTAFAYVDPGSGSVIVTTILGLIAAIGYTFRKYFYKLRRVFGGKSDNPKANDEK